MAEQVLCSLLGSTPIMTVVALSLVNPFKYAFVSAKVSALLAKLLSSHQYKRLIDADSLGDALDSLRQTHYGSAVADLEVGEDFSLMLDKAIYGVVQKMMWRMLQYSPNIVRPFLRSVIEREEHRALKSVLKAILMGVDASHAVSKIAPFGRYTPDVCLDIIREGSSEKALDYVKDSSLRKEISSALTGKMEEEFVFEVDMIVERHSIQKLVSESKRFKGIDKEKIKVLLGYEADIRNIVSTFRAVNLGLSTDEARRFWIPFHLHITEAKLALMVEAEDASKSISLIPDIYKNITHGLRGSEREFLSTLELSGERYLASKYVGTFAGYRLHIGLIWAYLRRLMYEASDIRTILIGKVYDFRPVEIENKLILPNLH
ncbi:MAG: V-type ATPase subunit [Nitrososphaerales archaeon]